MNKEDKYFNFSLSDLKSSYALLKEPFSWYRMGFDVICVMHDLKEDIISMYDCKLASPPYNMFHLETVEGKEYLVFSIMTTINEGGSEIRILISEPTEFGLKVRFNKHSQYLFIKNSVGDEYRFWFY